MKKLYFGLGLALMLIFSCTSCNESYAKTPETTENTSTTTIYLSLIHIQMCIRDRGKAVIGEETVDIYVGFGTDRYIGFSVDEFDEFGNRKTVFMGDCQFYEDRCVVTPREGKDQLFNGEYDTITFTRIGLESTST